MSKVDEFKNFVRNNPTLIKHIKSEEMTWQKFYEIYDLYGEDENVWNEYLVIKEPKKDNNTGNSSNSSFKLEDIMKMVKNMDVNKVQDSLTSLQKTLSLFGDLFVSKDGGKTSTYNPRPLYRKFED